MSVHFQPNPTLNELREIAIVLDERHPGTGVKDEFEKLIEADRLGARADLTRSICRAKNPTGAQELYLAYASRAELVETTAICRSRARALRRAWINGG